MKKVSSFLLVLAVLITCTGCGLSFSSSSHSTDTQETEPPKTADTILGEYIVANGDSSQGVYTLKNIDKNGTETFISWLPNEQALSYSYTYYLSEFQMTCRASMVLRYGKEFQTVQHYTTYSDGDTFTSTCQISTASYCLKNAPIYSFTTDDPYSEDASSIQLLTLNLFIHIEQLLSETAAEITLQDLGFTNWTSTL